MIDLVYAHPYPDRSRANRVLLDAVRTLPDVEVRSLYDLYPDFAIDAEAEQASLRKSSVLVIQHPVHWYGPPALLSLWFEKVLAHGFAYGPGEHAVRGKTCQWVVTAGGDERAYSAEGMHGHPFTTYEPAMRQTALFCGMKWAEPLVLLGAHRVSEAELRDTAERYRDVLCAHLAKEPRDA